MAFSYKKDAKRTIKHLTFRKDIYLKHGRNAEAEVLSKKIKRLKDNGV